MPRPIFLRLLLGASVWVLLLFAPTVTIIPRVLLLAILVVVPLALWLADAPALLLNCQLIAALPSVIAFLLPAGFLAGGLSLSWLVFTGLVAVLGWVRLRAHRLNDAAELCFTVGMFYLPVGGMWLAASRFGISLLGFGEPIVSLTAAHFHYAGFAALIISGLTGRQLARLPDTAQGAAHNAARTIYRVMATGLIIGMMLVAAGITFSPLLEVVAALVFAASLVGLAVIQLRYIVPRLTRRLPQILLGLSALLVMWAMGAAVLYALSEYIQSAWITIPQMLRVHGEVNALGFVLLNLAGWALLRGRQPTAGG
jgi:YndJ-like protein